MDIVFSFILASSAEAWQSVPLMTLHLPFMGYVLNINIWAICTAIAIML